MIEGVRRPVVAGGLIPADVFDAGIRDLHRTADPDGVFCYTFFKAVGERGRGPSPLRGRVLASDREPVPPPQRSR